MAFNRYSRSAGSTRRRSPARRAASRRRASSGSGRSRGRSENVMRIVIEQVPASGVSRVGVVNPTAIPKKAKGAAKL